VSSREVVRRCSVAAVSALISALALKAAPVSDLCTGPACLLIGLVVAPLLVFGAASLAWVLMALARLRPAWPVALAGLVTLSAVLTTVVDVGSFPVFASVAAACYAFAALVTADGLPVAWRVALGSPVVVLFAWGLVRPILL
jgi:hypothetical protein